MRLTTTQAVEHHVTIPRHDSLRVGTLNAILKDVTEHLGMLREKLLESLLGKRMPFDSPVVRAPLGIPVIHTR